VNPVRIPADIDRPDAVIGDLSARQAAVLGSGLLAGWCLVSALHPVLGWPAGLAIAAVPALAAFAVTVARRDGLAGEQLVVAAVRHALAPKRLVPAPEGLAPLPAYAARATRRSGQPAVAPLDLPVQGVVGDGLVDLGRDGAAVLCEVTPVNFGLRTPREQEALVAAYARLLHADLGTWQTLVTTRAVDPAPLAARIEEASGGLPHPALEAAARGHAAHLVRLAAGRGLLARRVLLVLREPASLPVAAGVLARRAEQAVASTFLPGRTGAAPVALSDVPVQLGGGW